MQNNEILDYFIELLNPTGNICILVMRNHLQNNCGLYMVMARNKHWYCNYQLLRKWDYYIL